MMEAASPISQVPKTAGDSDSVSTPRPGGGGQWERFEVVLSKPSGRQKLGMVLKHAQIVGKDRVKRGAYLAGLAEGPSVAQDLGLAPKDRLISVEGEDVKTLAFDRIVGLIRKAVFPLTLVWSRQRKSDIAVKLPGTALANQRSRSSNSLDSPRASTPTATATALATTPSPLTNGIPAVALGNNNNNNNNNKTVDGEASRRLTSPHPHSQTQRMTPAPTGAGSTSSTDRNGDRGSLGGSGTCCGSISGTGAEAGAGAGGGIGIGADRTMVENGGPIGAGNGNEMPMVEGGVLVPSSSSGRGIGDGGGGGAEEDETYGSNSNSTEPQMSLADVAEDWVRTTHRGRAASRATREAEQPEGARTEPGGSGSGLLRVPRISTADMGQQAHRAPIADPIASVSGKGQSEQQQSRPVIPMAPAYATAPGVITNSGNSKDGRGVTAMEWETHDVKQMEAMQQQQHQQRRHQQNQQQHQQSKQPKQQQLHGEGQGAVYPQVHRQDGRGVGHMGASGQGGGGAGARTGAGGGRLPNAAAQAAVAQVLAHQVGVAGLPGVPPVPSMPTGRMSPPEWSQRPNSPTPSGIEDGFVGNAREGSGGAVGVGGSNSDDAASWKAREVLSEKERKAEITKQKRRERDKARREERRREQTALDAGARFLHSGPDLLSPGGDSRQAPISSIMTNNSTTSTNNINNNINFFSQQQQQQQQRSGKSQGQGPGGGPTRQRRSSGGRSSKEKKGRGGRVGEGGAPSSAGSPDWLTPLMRAGLRDFIGTRYARSRLKQTLSHEWAQQEYRTGIALGHVDRSVTEIDFMRRRMAGGSLYSLLEQEAKDYLRPGAYTDSELEQLGASFARVASTGGAQANPIALDGASVSDTTNNPNPKTSADADANAKAQNKIASSFYKNPEGGTWADRLRSFQIDVPETGLEAMTSERERMLLEGGGGGLGGGDGGVSGAGSGERGGSGGGGGSGASGSSGEGGPSWDGQGVEASTVIQHRRRFDARCTAYEALNNASKNDKTSGLVEKAHQLHREHLYIVVAKRGTLEGTLENVRSQLTVREDQLRVLRMEQRGLNPLDPTAGAQLADSEGAILTRITEKKLQMMMIMEEAGKVVEWERTADVARREALLHASDVHGHGGASAAEAAQERGALVDAMMAQKATIMLLSTFCKLRGPWLAPTGNVRNSPPPLANSNNTSSTGTHEPSVGSSSSNPSALGETRGLRGGLSAGGGVNALGGAGAVTAGGCERVGSAAAGDMNAARSMKFPGKGLEKPEQQQQQKRNITSPIHGTVAGGAISPGGGGGGGGGRQAVQVGKPVRKPIKLRLLPPSKTGGQQQQQQQRQKDSPQFPLSPSDSSLLVASASPTTVTAPTETDIIEGGSTGGGGRGAVLPARSSPARSASGASASPAATSRFATRGGKEAVMARLAREAAASNTEAAESPTSLSSAEGGEGGGEDEEEDEEEGMEEGEREEEKVGVGGADESHLSGTTTPAMEEDSPAGEEEEEEEGEDSDNDNDDSSGVGNDGGGDSDGGDGDGAMDEDEDDEEDKDEDEDEDILAVATPTDAGAS